MNLDNILYDIINNMHIIPYVNDNKQNHNDIISHIIL